MKNYVIWTLKIIAIAILVQTLYFKFTAAPESVFIFQAVYAEPWGRIATGIGELIASILMLIPRVSAWGALLGAGMMSGAILTHLTILGIEVRDDGGLLFSLAIVVFLCCLCILWDKKEDLVGNP